MSKVAREDLIAFGKAVKKARVMQGQTLKKLGFAVLGRDESKGYVSAIENGRRQITPLTAAKFTKHLKLDEALLDPFLEAPEMVEDEVTADDTKAERLLQMSEKDDLARNTSEALLISLAYEFAQEAHDEVFTAYQSLRGALEEAARLKERGNLPQNVDDQLQAVMQRVAAHNDAGDRDAGQAEIDEAFKQNEAAAIALCNLGFEQAHVRNDADLAAKLIVKRLKLEARPEGLFNAIINENNELNEKGFGQISRFHDKVRLNLSTNNMSRAKGTQKGWAVYNHSINLCALALQEQGVARLEKAKAYAQHAANLGKKFNIIRLRVLALNQYSSCLSKISERQGGEVPPEDMERAARLAYSLILKAANAKVQDIANVARGLGSVLSDLGKTERNTEKLNEAINMLEKAKIHFEKLGIEGTIFLKDNHASIALAHLRRGRLVQSGEDLQKAQVIFEMEATHTKKPQPFNWAIVQWNLADLALARWEVSGETEALDQAQSHLDAAREKFNEGLSEFQLNKCDELQVQIDDARGN